jgi:Flp pilus assembly protein TadG
MFFFVLVFGAIDFSWLLFNQMNIQDAVREAARYASTGNHLPDPNNPGSNLSRIASIDQIFANAAVGAVCPAPTVSSVAGGVGSAGGPGDTVTIAATCKVPLMTFALANLFPGNQFNFTVSASFNNEPFPSSQTK